MTDMKNPELLIESCCSALEGGYGSVVQVISILLFVLIFNLIIKKALLGLHEKFKHNQKVWHLSFVSSLCKPLSYFFWFLAIFLALDVLSINSLGAPIPRLNTIISIVATLSLGWFFLRWKSSLIHQMLNLSSHRKIEMEVGKLDLIGKVLTIAIITIVALTLMDITGNNIQTLVALGGISGVALAFASQQFISNFFGGLTIHFTQPFSIGQLIKIPERKIEGYVEDIGWYMTSIRDLENYPIYIPNSIFNQSVVTNSSRVTFRRIYVKIGIRYKDITVINQLIQHIRKLFEDYAPIHKEKETKIFFINFGPTSLEIEISSYLLKETAFEQSKQDLLIKVASIISENGAELASITNILELKNSVE